MYMINNRGLNEVVMGAINGIEAGDTKKEAVESIASFVEGNYINKDMIQDLSNLSIADVEKLGDLGFVFNISDGKVSGMVLSRRS